MSFTDFTGFTDSTDLPVLTLDVENILSNCDFIDLQYLCPFISSLSFTILMLNVRSIKRNFNVFLSEFCNYLKMFSIIVLTETWLTGDRDKAFNIPGFYSFNLYRNQFGGRLRLYVKDCFKAKVLDDFTSLCESYEILSIVLDVSDFKYVLMLIYHPPTSSSQKNTEFIESFTLKLRMVQRLKMPVLVAGDINLDLFNPNNFNYIDLFINNMLELNMLPLVTRPTRALFSSLQLILTFDNFNLVFSHFYKMLFLAYDTAFPIIKKKLQTKADAPWVTEKIRKCILKKNKLYKLYLKGRIEKMVYSTFRNKLTCIIRRVKALYYAELFLENSSDPKKIWDILNGLINNGSKTVLEEIIVNNTTLKGKRMVNYINDFFINIALSIRNGQPLLQLFRCLAPIIAVSCFFRPTNTVEMKKIIRQLKNKGNRILDIHPLIIKDNIDAFADRLVIAYYIIYRLRNVFFRTS